MTLYFKSLTLEEHKELVKIPTEKIHAYLLDVVRKPPLFLSGYRKMLLEEKLTAPERRLVSEVLADPVLRREIEAIPKLFFKLDKHELKELRRILREEPEKLPRILPPIIPPPIELPAKVPVPIPPPIKLPAKVPVPIPPPIKLPVKIPPVRPPSYPMRITPRWRAYYPFRTSTFIRAFLKGRGDKGAYPYEVWNAYRKALIGIISETTRKEIEEREEIPIDGYIDGFLAKEVLEGIPAATIPKVREGIKAAMLRATEYHICTYQSFWRYFMILERLKLIKKEGTRVMSPTTKKWKTKHYTRQYYVLVKEKEDSPMWLSPQVYLYPLSKLGRVRYKVLKETAEALDMSPMELFEEENPELMEHIRKVRGFE